jgi:hypothetical protein
MAGGGLGAWGQSQLQNAVTGFFGNDYLRDYQHASKTFLPNGFQNSPKLKFLFHTVFEINTDIVNLPQDNINISVLVKTVKLPSFTIETGILNQYNRKRLNTTKIKYDPVELTFHDDVGNVVSSLWYRYYTYYFQDGLNPAVTLNGKSGAVPNATNVGGGVNAPLLDYTTRTQYVPSTTSFKNWGYNSQGAGSNPSVKQPFFKNITVFGINNHQWISYTFVNPLITRFGHDTYDYSEGGGVMANSMTIDYETVVYNQGVLDGTNPGNILQGFGDPSVYDRTTSPIMTPGGNATVLGQGGLIGAAGGFINDITQGNILGAARTAGVTYNTVKNINPTSFITSTITQALTGALNSTANPNRNTSWEIPVFGQSASQPTAGQSIGGISIPQTYQQLGQNLGLGNIANINNQISSVSSSINQTLSNVFGIGQTAGTQLPDNSTLPPAPY